MDPSHETNPKFEKNLNESLMTKVTTPSLKNSGNKLIKSLDYFQCQNSNLNNNLVGFLRESAFGAARLGVGARSYATE